MVTGIDEVMYNQDSPKLGNVFNKGSIFDRRLDMKKINIANLNTEEEWGDTDNLITAKSKNPKLTDASGFISTAHR